jgi:hypothetical protein
MPFFLSSIQVIQFIQDFINKIIDFVGEKLHIPSALITQLKNLILDFDIPLLGGLLR